MNNVNEITPAKKITPAQLNEVFMKHYAPVFVTTSVVSDNKTELCELIETEELTTED